MDDLIKALQILRKYGNPNRPTICEHEMLYIVNIDTTKVTDKDKKELEELGFYYSKEDENFYSYQFGSA